MSVTVAILSQIPVPMFLYQPLATRHWVQASLLAAHFWQFTSAQGTKSDKALLNPYVSVAVATLSHMLVPVFLYQPEVH